MDDGSFGEEVFVLCFGQFFDYYYYYYNFQYYQQFFEY